jgi:small GTP-binding protein
MQPTVGIDFVTKTMQIEGETLRLQLWDTAGQERFRALIPSYVRDADACLIVIDVSIRASLEGVDKWLDFVRESRGQEAMIFLVGNKSDIAEREVSKK